jgi:hypothetical protein
LGNNLPLPKPPLDRGTAGNKNTVDILNVGVGEVGGSLIKDIASPAGGLSTEGDRGWTVFHHNLS